MKKIGILGGTFDPPHNAHLEIARAALIQYGLDCVRFMTGGMPPHKRHKKVTPAVIRFEMTKLLVDGEEKFIADDYEILKKDYSYTVNTLKELKNLHPDWEIYFIIGEDSLKDFPKWYMPQKIAKNCILLVYPRRGNSDIDFLIKERRTEYGADIRIIDAPMRDISSTMIRNRIKNGEDTNGFLPNTVMEFIKENGLYT